MATGVNGAWSAYRQCAATSAFYKSQLELFTTTSLWLGIAGAVLGTVAQLVSPNPGSITTKALGIAGSLAVALAGLAATQAVSGDKEKLWIRCRAAGEALKSAVYLYSASVPPFDAPERGVALAQCVEKALRDLDGVALRPGKLDKPPPGALNVAEYLAAPRGRSDRLLYAWREQVSEKSGFLAILRVGGSSYERRAGGYLGHVFAFSLGGAVGYRDHFDYRVRQESSLRTYDRVVSGDGDAAPAIEGSMAGQRQDGDRQSGSGFADSTL